MHDARQVLTDHNLRCTRQRLEVYDTLAACKCHPTAEQLHRMVQERSPGTSLATVYNTLEAVCRAGLCRKITTADGVARYDADLSSHLHLLTADGRVLDIPHDVGQEILSRLIPELTDRLEASLGLKLEEVSVQVLGRAREA